LLPAPLSVGAEPPGKSYATPEACFAAAQAAKANDDIAVTFSCLTEYARMRFLGETAFRLEQHILFGHPGAAEGEQLRKQHGLAGIDIMGHMQLLAATGRDPYPAFAEAGGWVVEPVTFANGVTKLIAAAPQKAVANLEAEIAATPGRFAQRRAAAKNATERGDVEREERERLAELQEALAAAKKHLQATQAPQPKIDATLVNVKIDGETATAEVKAGDETLGPVYFKKIGGEWRMTFYSPEPEVKLPTADERRQARLQLLGFLHIKDDQKPWAFDTRDDAVRFTDDDLKFVASFERIGFIRIHGAEQITDQGLASLAAMPELTGLMFENLNLTSKGIAELAKFKKLDLLILVNLDVDDATIASLSRALPEGLILERYSLQGKTLDGPFAEARDANRIVIHVVSEGVSPLSEKTAHADNPALKPMVRLVRQSQAQVLSDVVYLPDEPDWTKTRPWFKSKDLPQYAFFLPGEDKPAMVVGDVSAERFTAALREVLRKKEAAALLK
jgi:hypothetical protein